MTRKFIAAIFVFILFAILFYIFPPNATDFRFVFYPVSHITLHPYDIKAFNYFPWTALLIFPMRFLSVNVGSAINTSINLVVIGSLVIKRKGGRLALFLSLTSYPFLSLLANGSIEWIPAIGFIIQGGWGLPLLMVKPQSAILAALSWFQVAKNKWLFLAPVACTVTISFIIWGNWPLELIANIQSVNGVMRDVNISPFPWLIPFGIGLIYYIIKRKPANSEILGAAATYCLVPYFVPHSLTILFALLSVSCRRLSILIWALLWTFPIISNWTVFVQILGSL
jgi:hypothetical protein